jgi:hypothetical protein
MAVCSVFVQQLLLHLLVSHLVLQKTHIMMVYYYYPSCILFRCDDTMTRFTKLLCNHFASTQKKASERKKQQHHFGTHNIFSLLAFCNFIIIYILYRCCKLNEMITYNKAEVFTRLLSFCWLLAGVDCFAAWMVNEHCDRLVRPGAVIMNAVVEESLDRRVRVHRHFFTESGERREEELWLEGGNNYFFPGEELTVSVSSSTSTAAEDPSANTEFLFETSVQGGRFLGEEEGCAHTRTASNGQVLTMPQFRTEVKLWVGKCSAHSVRKDG